MIKLTPEQRQALQTAEPIVSTNTAYILVREDVYERIKGLLSDEDWARDAYQAAMEVFARDGWDDPRMDVYHAPRRRRWNCPEAENYSPVDFFVA